MSKRSPLSLLLIACCAALSVACTEKVIRATATDPTVPGEGDTEDPAEEETPAASDPGSTPPSGKADSGSTPKPPSKNDGGSSSPAPGASFTPPPGFTGIGTSVAECNGTGLVLLYGPGTTTQQHNVKTVWVYGTDPVTGTNNKVFGYTRSQISNKTLPLSGNTGEKQVRLSILAPNPTLVAGAQYQGTIVLSEWDASTSSWSTIAGTTSTALVFIDSFSADQTAWSDGHLCAGKVSGHVESIADGTGATRLDYYFVAPLLTPSFPL